MRAGVARPRRSHAPVRATLSTVTGNQLAILSALALAAAPACTNDPSPARDATGNAEFLYYPVAPKTLDPAIAYSTVDHAVTGAVYDTLLQYAYLERPYRLIPGLAEEVPLPVVQADGRVRYTLRLRPDLLFHEDPCFRLGGAGRRTRPITAADIAFQIMRLADPAVGSPVAANFERIQGFADFGRRLAERRERDTRFVEMRIDEQYAALGGMSGLRVRSVHDFEIVLTRAWPQIVYWLAMEFTTPLPWEAVVWYNGKEGRPTLAEHAVGNGPFRLARYDKQSRIVLERSPEWYGRRHPEWHAPGATYPSTGSAEDRAAGLLDPRYTGQPLPFLDRVELRLEKEPMPAFTKFLQGYYDLSQIVEEQFDQIVPEGSLSPEMRQRGLDLKTTAVPAIFYVGFNMDDAVVGAPGGSRSRLLRQAMSLAIDSREFIRVFINDRGLPAESPIPPGIEGHHAGLPNPFRQVDLERARGLLRLAGVPGGIDPATAEPLRLTFDTYDTSARGMVRYQWLVDSWRRIGLDVTIAATTYNQFQDKVRRNAYQIFFWGWVADYPDAENFLFLLWSRMGRTASGGPNTANFANAEYDTLFLQMRDRPPGPERNALIARMVEIVERERPWIELFYPEDYTLHHGWLRNLKPLGMSFSILKYLALDPERRAELRREWNEPVLWPAALTGLLVVASVLAAARTWWRERQ